MLVRYKQVLLDKIETEKNEFSKITDYEEDYIKQLIYQKDEFIFNFLKSNGYRPKKTKKYIEGLVYRLKRKGLRLKIETTNIPCYHDVEWNFIVRVETICRFEKI